MYIYISKYIYFYEIKNDKTTDVIVQQFKYWKGHIIFHVQRELNYLYLDLPVLLRACTITAEEKETEGDRIQCACQSDSVLSPTKDCSLGAFHSPGPLRGFT